jgi:hypothetical protein
MQLTVTDNYLAMIELLAGLVKRHLAQPVRKLTLAKVDERTFLLVSAALEQEDEDLTDWELTAELLGSREFRKIA